LRIEIKRKISGQFRTVIIKYLTFWVCRFDVFRDFLERSQNKKEGQKFDDYKESFHKHQIMLLDKIPNPFQVILDRCTEHRHCDR